MKPNNPFMLGLSHVRNSTEVLGLCLEGNGWLSSSIKLGIRVDDPNHAEVFLDKLIHTKRDVVFVVPPRLYSHPVSKNTRTEMDYWLNHPEAAKKLYLVFGGVDLIDKEWLNENTEKFRTP